MESLEKDHSYSENPQQPVVSAEDYAVPEVVVTRHLRDRELLRKRKAEAEEKNTHQWVLREQKRSKPTGRGRGARRGRGRGRGRGQQQAPEPQEEPQPEVVEEEKPELQVTKLEEEAQKSLDLPVKSSIPFLEAGELYTQKELAEGIPLASAAEELCTQQETAGAIPAGSAVFSMEPEETPRSEEPREIPQSVGNDHLEQEFYGSL
ncbi:hemogen [Zootoca vivipara]|uniref:hemogen n=1 Tax=Zootoca vivipara TaxID=8524 RepID=UPI00293BDF0C|nr:hemogen [Zootoca vivipara]